MKYNESILADSANTSYGDEYHADMEEFSIFDEAVGFREGSNYMTSHVSKQIYPSAMTSMGMMRDHSPLNEYTSTQSNHFHCYGSECIEESKHVDLYQGSAYMSDKHMGSRTNDHYFGTAYFPDTNGDSSTYASNSGSLGGSRHPYLEVTEEPSGTYCSNQPDRFYGDYTGYENTEVLDLTSSTEWVPSCLRSPSNPNSLSPPGVSDRRELWLMDPSPLPPAQLTFPMTQSLPKESRNGRKSNLSPYSKQWTPRANQHAQNVHAHGRTHTKHSPAKAQIQNPYACYPKDSQQRESADGFVYQVRFKHVSKYYLLASSALTGSPPLRIENGSYVKVEADRGEDVGMVIGKLYLDGFKESKLTVGRFGASNGEYKRVTRLATVEENNLLRVKATEEKKAVEICRQKIHDAGLPMKVVDAEFQFDRRKLTFYFEASKRVDFRELVCELFSLYKTRIWMQQVEATYHTNQDGETVPKLHLIKHQG
eukprot:CAMPEP_0185038256 /NCGR_PEP_ID=MMETSP1103-20130426/33688_1 /TAXON_ID=36769 /ORGANISM="Paraphysomonas bandaiensis, Strain Caron Lab Isolate" /LENGTH=480 /DNA_ID=CAMNT_0027576607 /DNA_START=162 /DNA_END=1604 /DNA_ORIENTATION=-